MEKSINRQQMQSILDSAPQGVDKKALIDKFVSDGYTVEGINDKKEPNILQSLVGGLAKAPAALGQSVGAGAIAGFNTLTKGGDLGTNYQEASKLYQKSGEQLGGALFGESVQPVQNAEQLTGNLLQTGAALAPGNLASKGATTLGKIGLGALEGAGIGAAFLGGEAMANNASAGEVAQQALTGAAFGAPLGAALPAAQAAIPAIKSLSKSAETIADPLLSGQNIREKIQAYMGSKTVQPQFGTAAERLIKTPRSESPLQSYNRYAQQAEKSLSDDKVDAPISEIGSKIGDEFRKVISLRRDAGKMMGDELKTIGKTKVNIEPVFSNFETALRDSGLIYNGMTKKIVATDLSKVAPEDINIIEDFVKELNKIGTTPSLEKIDAIIARVNAKIDYDKSAKGIVSTTNGERIVKSALAGLRNSFGNVAGLEKYNQARATYGELTNFIEEGARYLGKITQSGDFAKDASLAKSAVQSILDSGKKDWLLKLEGLTGYKALDEARLALQAMKDAGDFRGLSLLQTMTEGQPPLTKAGATQKVIDYGIEKGAQIISGTPAERTKAYLKSLEKTTKSKAAEKAIKELSPLNKSIPQATKKTNDNFGFVPPVPTQDENGNFEITPESVAFALLGSIGIRKVKGLSPKEVAKTIDTKQFLALEKYVNNPTKQNAIAARSVGQDLGLADSFLLKEDLFKLYAKELVDTKEEVMNNLAKLLAGKEKANTIKRFEQATGRKLD